MKGLVVGGGSIGTRHLQNLKLLGIDSLALVDPDGARKNPIAVSLPTLTEGLAWAPDFVVLASPTHLHAEQALAVVSRGVPVFVEKPLTHTAVGLPELVKETAARRLVTMVGCNMRFHPGPAQVKKLLEKDAVGVPYFGRVHVGSYLPDWRPGRDYRETYSARAEMGGGCLLDNIHEVDLARWYLGEVTDVFCRAERISRLEMDVEDVAILILKHRAGTFSEVHLDYVQRTYERGCQIVGQAGSVFWDFREGNVRWYDARTARWETFAQPADWNINQMYVDEMEHFIECVREQRRTCFPIEEAAHVTKVVLAAKESSRSDRMLPTGIL